MSRKCDGCTKCCDGWLYGEAHGHRFWPGRPCHFIGKKGCTIYKTRPHDPCKTFECLWLTNKEVPEWLKPDLQNLIIAANVIDGIPYWRAVEAGEKISVEALSWLFTYCVPKNINLFYNIGSGHFMFGSPEFIEAMGKST